MDTTLTNAEIEALVDMVLERLHAALKEDEPVAHAEAEQ